MLAYVRYDKAKFQYDLTNQYFRAAVTPGRTGGVNPANLFSSAPALHTAHPHFPRRHQTKGIRNSEPHSHAIHTTGTTDHPPHSNLHASARSDEAGVSNH